MYPNKIPHPTPEWEAYSIVAAEVANFLGTKNATMLLSLLRGKEKNFDVKLNYILMASAAKEFSIDTAEDILYQGRIHEIGRIRDVLFYVLHETCGMSYRRISKIYYTPYTTVRRKAMLFESYKRNNIYKDYLQLEKRLSELAKLLKELFSYE